MEPGGQSSEEKAKLTFPAARPELPQSHMPPAAITRAASKPAHWAVGREMNAAQAGCKPLWNDAEKGGERVDWDIPMIPTVPYVFLLILILFNLVSNLLGYVLIHDSISSDSYSKYIDILKNASDFLIIWTSIAYPHLYPQLEPF